MTAINVAIGITGLVGAALALAIGAMVYVVAPSRWQNRIVALLLFFAAMEVGTTFGLAQLRAWDAGTTRGFDAVNHLTWLVEPWLYLALLGTLATPLAAPLRGPRRQRVLVAIGLAMVPAWLLVGRFVLDSLAVIGLALGFHAMVMLVGVVIAVSAWRRLPLGSSERARARAFALAFGARDLGTGVVGTFSAVTLLTTGSNLTPAPVFLLVPLSVALCALLMGYGIARVSLFNIDLKVKWTISRGTISAVFLAVFFITAQVVQNYTSTTLGWLGGAVVAGLLLFFLRPVEKAANRLADAAMPKTEATPAYVAFRKMEVYKAAVEELSVGGVSAKERRALDALRAKLGLSSVDALTLEKDISTSRGVA